MIFRAPFSNITPTSPVQTQSLCKALAVFYGSLKYPCMQDGPQIQTSPLGGESWVEYPIDGISLNLILTF